MMTARQDYNDFIVSPGIPISINVNPCSSVNPKRPPWLRLRKNCQRKQVLKNNRRSNDVDDFFIRLIFLLSDRRYLFFVIYIEIKKNCSNQNDGTMIMNLEIIQDETIRRFNRSQTWKLYGVFRRWAYKTCILGPRMHVSMIP